MLRELPNGELLYRSYRSLLSSWLVTILIANSFVFFRTYSRSMGGQSSSVNGLTPVIT
jgi:hypothetical protein